MKNIKLNNGNSIPVLGLGTYKNTNQKEITNSIKSAYENGIKHIDTAEVYFNEPIIGKAIRELNIDRKELFITSKVWNSDQGYDSTLKAFEHTVNNLQTDYLDLYLIHWAVEDKFIDTWKAMERLYKQGVIKNIGVSNFQKHHLETLFDNTTIIPAVNQIELHPYMIQKELRNFCNQHNIIIESWSPIAKGAVTKDKILQNIGKKYGKSAVQVTLRWHFQLGLVTIPKSTNSERIAQSADVFDFELSESEMNEICNLNKNTRFGPDPDNFNFNF
jgi:methylglyoxal/glyoxal reductase